MSEKLISGWPEGTKEIKKSDGKKEIVLPESTDMNEHSREELLRNVLMRQLAKDARVAELLNPQFSTRGSKENIKAISAGKEERLVAGERVHRRQEEIREARGQERKFREEQRDVNL